MLTVLQQPYVLAAAISVVAAVLAYLYSRVTDTADQGRPAKTFFRTLAVTALAAGALTYLSTSRGGPEVVATEPFDAVLPAVAQPAGL